MEIVSSKNHPLQGVASVDDFLNVAVTETISLFEYLEFNFLLEYDVFAPSTPGNRSGAMTPSATSFSSDTERKSSGSGRLNTPRPRYFLVVSSAIRLYRSRQLWSTDTIETIEERKKALKTVENELRSEHRN